MANLDETTRNTVVDAVSALLDDGDIQFQEADDSEVCTHDLSADSFPAASSGQASANTISDDTNAAGGTIDHAVLRTSGGTERIQLTCGTSGAEVNWSSLTIGAGDTTQVSSLTMTMPAS
jgi:hypothetical protein